MKHSSSCRPAGKSPASTFSKKTPGPPTPHHIREWAARLERLDGIIDPKPFLKDIPHTKVRQFAAEATALEIGDMRERLIALAPAVPTCGDEQAIMPRLQPVTDKMLIAPEAEG